MRKRSLSVALGLAGGVLLLAPPVSARTAAVTKIRFKLDAHEVQVGTDLTGSVRVWTRAEHAWAPLAGAELTVSVDGVGIGTLTTDGDGLAEVAYTATAEGEHTMKVVFAGDDTHKKAKRAQGFTVTAAPSP